MKQIIFSLLVFVTSVSIAQSVTGKVTNTKGEAVPFASVLLQETNNGTVTDKEGNYILENVDAGSYTVKVRYLGYISVTEKINLSEGQSLKKNFTLKEDALYLDDVVVTGTRNVQDRVNNPVVVGVIDNKLLNATQSVAISEGLNFNTGVRVETNCQNCGFTQVRLNGLEGAYSQILINSRPIFSALNSVYGLDQIPTNIVERIEVVRGGGSALYGSNAIAGTVNIITREPVENNWEIRSNTAAIDGDALDQTFNINGTIVNESLTSGVSVYGMSRNRDSYDADGDGFTELVELNNTVFGAKAFFKPSDLSKITLS
jgi:outer membrane receptor for ferrienterochelin and colicins